MNDDLELCFRAYLSQCPNKELTVDLREVYDVFETEIVMKRKKGCVTLKLVKVPKKKVPKYPK